MKKKSPKKNIVGLIIEIDHEFTDGQTQWCYGHVNSLQELSYMNDMEYTWGYETIDQLNNMFTFSFLHKLGRYLPLTKQKQEEYGWTWQFQDYPLDHKKGQGFFPVTKIIAERRNKIDTTVQGSHIYD